MNEKQNLYFIAIIPPSEVCAGITAFKKDFFDRFESKAALKVIPHITLKAPFKLPVSEHDELIKWFRQLSVNSEPFIVELKDFGAFPKLHSPVIYVHPVMNMPLHVLQKDIIWNFRMAFPQVEIMDLELKFHPHMTIAYRDLHPDLFRKAWKEYSNKKYSAEFTLSEFHLLQHNGKEWQILDTYRLPIR